MIQNRHQIICLWKTHLLLRSRACSVSHFHLAPKEREATSLSKKNLLSVYTGDNILWLFLSRVCSFMAVKRCKTEEPTLTHLSVKTDSVMISDLLSLVCPIYKQTNKNPNKEFFLGKHLPCRQIFRYIILAVSCLSNILCLSTVLIPAGNNQNWET